MIVLDLERCGEDGFISYFLSNKRSRRGVCGLG